MFLNLQQKKHRKMNSAEGGLAMKPELTYIRSGDYWIPNLKLESTEERPLNKYGQMRRTFLREHKPIQYSLLAMQQKLFPHLWEVQ